MTWNGKGGNCCCPPGECCCTPEADNYLAEFTGITDGTETGCDTLNSKYCLCWHACNLYSNSRATIDNVGPYAGDCPDGDTAGFILNLSFECEDNRVRLYVYANC